MEHNRKNARLYSETDIGRLIQRATALQQKNEATERGLSLDEIKQFAAELGVDPAYMEQAAIDLDGESLERGGFTLSGSPFGATDTRVVEGTIDEDTWDEMVLQLRKLEGVRGDIKDFGKIREWVYELDGLFSTRVSMRPQKEQTVIEIHKDHRGMAYTAYFVSVFIGVTLAGISLDGSGLPDMLMYALAGSGGIGGLVSVRAALSIWKKAQVKKVKRIASRIAEILGSNAPSLDAHSSVTEAPSELRIPDGGEYGDLTDGTGIRTNGQINT